MPGYPIELDLRGRTVLVVGLGTVGRRKASGLIKAKARVVGVDPSPTLDDVPDGVQIEIEIEIKTEPYRPEHLDGMSLVFACATPEVNRRVALDAREAGVWVNSSSSPEEGDVFLPAVWRDGGLLLTVSTSGASPALAKALVDRAAEAIGPAAAGLAAVLAELRPLVLARIDDPEARRRVLADWGDPRWLTLWTEQGPQGVREEVQSLCRRVGEAERNPPERP